ncbi:Dyp-type peroxidase [Gordonia pseudamarae]|jgi:putative iron-dependent peroxidase|uniref:Dyp-type peroxidase n=1 Tax=Gordonia pseudamarae TaxID=2831662 RepID=A0ABX6ICS9_9ACTN|nr:MULTISPECIES: Dyp-type peroxidase [Gordonia]MBD0023975.1 Dyp-type peroxidase [Gordonia sp. (in: high G+C Gram-positive bacteria)]QHN24795.1 Dyp-type peroxidase [Gordonia pseudamarae]QHN33728.1 Dyp-type peroxidase [Gordonia pseudamarae]
MPVATPQTILTRKTKAAIFLVATITDGAEQTVHDFLPEVSGLTSAVSSRAPEAALAAIVGIGSDAWDRLFDGPRPASLHPFVPLAGPVHAAPSTPGDLLFHIKADQMDQCYEVGRLITGALGDAITVLDEVHGFRYFDLRDLIGFVDGTENPTGQDAVDTITADDDDGCAGGSYVAIQRYVHDLKAWRALSTSAQEAAIGRTKSDNVEMSDEVKPTNSHIALNVVTDENGTELDIVRDNMPYGNVSGTGESGTFFIAYSSTPDITERMLRNMFLGDPPGNHDRLLDFTTAVTGTQFYAPTVEFLGDPPPLPGTDADPQPPVSEPANGSLGIGSLR